MGINPANPEACAILTYRYRFSQHLEKLASNRRRLYSCSL